MKTLILGLFLVACGGGQSRSFEQATRDQALCETENKWVEQRKPGYWVAVCGDDDGNPLHDARR